MKRVKSFGCLVINLPWPNWFRTSREELVSTDYLDRRSIVSRHRPPPIVERVPPLRYHLVTWCVWHACSTISNFLAPIITETEHKRIIPCPLHVRKLIRPDPNDEIAKKYSRESRYFELGKSVLFPPPLSKNFPPITNRVSSLDRRPVIGTLTFSYFDRKLFHRFHSIRVSLSSSESRVRPSFLA